MEKRKITEEQYFKKCEICGKEIVGTNPKQVNNNLAVHKMTHEGDE